MAPEEVLWNNYRNPKLYKDAKREGKQRKSRQNVNVFFFPLYSRDFIWIGKFTVSKEIMIDLHSTNEKKNEAVNITS